MGKGRSFEFVIKDAFSPETLPMARLAEYMADLATVVGEKEHVHFLEVRDGSAAVAYSVDHEAVPKTEACIRAVRLRAQSARILIPTPALSEFLTFASSDYLSTITNSRHFEIASFDQLAAVEAGLTLKKDLAGPRGKKAGSTDPWQA